MQASAYNIIPHRGPHAPREGIVPDAEREDYDGRGRYCDGELLTLTDHRPPRMMWNAHHPSRARQWANEAAGWAVRTASPSRHQSCFITRQSPVLAPLIPSLHSTALRQPVRAGGGR